MNIVIARATSGVRAAFAAPKSSCEILVGSWV